MIHFEHIRLDNGLDVIAEVNPEAQSTALGFMVKTGARDENSAFSGVSHFLEHMMFKGTSHRSAADVNCEFDAMGAVNNAFTSNEVTCYWAHVLPEFLDRALDLLADILRPALRPEDFNMEKKVILEEIALYLDRPGHVLYEAVMADYFQAHPLAQPVLGTTESVRALEADSMRRYFEARYGPGNMVLAAAGRLDFSLFLQQVKNVCGRWQHLEVQRRYPVPAPAPRRRHLTDARLKRHYLALMCPGPSAQDERRYAASVVADVIGDRDGSRLYWALLEPGLADEADFSFYPHDQTGSFFAYASCDPARREQVEQILIKELQQVAKGGVEEAEIGRSRNKIETAAVLQGELPLGRMRNISAHWTYNQEYRTLQEELARLEAVDLAQANRLVKEFPLAPMTITTLGPTPV